MDFINDSESITLFSAYIKLQELKAINHLERIKQIVVRWEIEDLCKGVSDLELYKYCLDNNIALYRNTRLHMKAFWNNEDKVLFGSANVTGKGVGEAANCNFELNGLAEGIKIEDLYYLNKVIASSEYVDNELYGKIKEVVDKTVQPIIEFPELTTKKGTVDHFLMSQLPMCKSPDDLYDIARKDDEYDTFEQNCAAHDLAIYNINPLIEYPLFKEELKAKFNSHPFILALKEYIKAQEFSSLRYGGVVDWIQINTTTVPTPQRWEIKKEEIVNNLYNWICEFDSNFTWDVPGARSQVIFYKKEFLNS
ncbi:hypothetical protein ACFS5J_04080 [Flavobacterium chuncheonense]|uniref:Phospholipase D-like domain-containing protein n=1 Tax=Flavobacterium chuncheonense TaxID=2026653 RepID=A0ABW5YJP4_9FLAO